MSEHQIIVLSILAIIWAVSGLLIATVTAKWVEGNKVERFLKIGFIVFVWPVWLSELIYKGEKLK